MNCELCIADSVKEFIEKHLKDDVNRLALAKFPEGIDREFVIRQIHARQVLSKKLPSWAENDELVFPKKLSLEQCSSELTAKYKAELLSTKSHEITRREFSEDSCSLADEKRILIDLTGGMGVDTAFLSDNFDKTYYVEMQEELCEIAKHNFKVMNKNIEVVNDNAEHFLTICDEVDCIYLDPARRDEYGRKMVSLHDCSPDVVELHDILLKKAKRVLVKVSPMLDIEMVKKELKDISEIHVVAVRNECKEILIEIQKFRNSETQDFETQRLKDADNDFATSINVTATDLREGWNFSYAENEEPEIFVSIHVNSAVSNDPNGIETHWYHDYSKELAEIVHKHMTKNLDSKDRGLFKSKFYVINHTTVPAILCEIGFLSNEEERNKLITDSRKQKTAKAIAEGIIEYLKRCK